MLRQLQYDPGTTGPQVTIITYNNLPYNFMRQTFLKMETYWALLFYYSRKNRVASPELL